MEVPMAEAAVLESKTANTEKLANIIVAGFEERWDVIWKGDVFIKDEAEVASSMGGGELSILAS